MMPAKIWNAEIMCKDPGPESRCGSVKGLFNGEFDEEV